MIGALDIALDPAGASPWRLAAAGGGMGATWAVGRPAEEVAGLMPLVFNLCGAAHAQASRQALALPPEAAGAAALARQERLRDHALAILSDWPSLLGQMPDHAALRGLATAEAPLWLRRHLLGRDLDLAGCTLGELDRWLAAAPSPTACGLADLRARVDPAWGRAELPAPAAADIAAALDAGAPTVPRETTAADEWRAVPLLRDLHAREGASLFLRMLARLLDLLACLDPAPCAPPQALPPAGPGIGLARAARGVLAHRARVAGGLVTDYRVLSPSAWNLAPDGLLARMLAALPLNDQTPMLARLVISCVNPCVKVTLRLGAREKAHA
ncbi:nickel-dependent hydrogenase large subunit [Ancylobacter sp. IITR112]|uniref:nickel-dependent hydrogenase large subunit n=1 Tax=Ancylobacter sp. IITR112 TaxID=3138073 RepID=UPI00352B0FAF